MYPLYQDIREKLGTPKWIDRNGVPRYSDFTPKEAAEIYCDWVALMTVECQACGKTFQCANSISWAHAAIHQKDYLLAKTPDVMVPYVAGWGDAPWHTFEGAEDEFDGQCAGTTMTTDFTEIRVWRREWPDWVEVENPMQYLPATQPISDEAPLGRPGRQAGLAQDDQRLIVNQDPGDQQ